MKAWNVSYGQFGCQFSIKHYEFTYSISGVGLIEEIITEITHFDGNTQTFLNILCHGNLLVMELL